jgi:hypothetical protein
MRHKLGMVLGSVILAGLALSTSYAQDQQKPVPEVAPSGHDMTGNTEMTAHPEMAAQMQRMMGNNPEMAAQMVRMMQNCNKMMESMMHQPPVAAAPEKKG